MVVDFTLDHFYSGGVGAEHRVQVIRGAYSMNLVEYLNAFNLDFYTADGSLFSGNELFEPKHDATPIGDDQLTVWRWDGVNLEGEVVPIDDRQSVHQRVQ